jgi:type I restriction enzyme, S subunit
MNRWPTKPLGELVSLEYGKALRAEERSPTGRYPVYGSNGIVGSFDEAIIKEPTIVVGRKGAIGEAHLAENGCWPIDTAFYTVLRQPGTISLPFLLLWFRSVDLKSLAITSTIPGLNRSTLYSQQVPVPPLAEQERIVKLLDEADELRKLRAQADRRTADLISALFHEMFGSDAPGSATWQTTTVAELAAAHEGSIRTGPFGSDLRHSEFVEEGVPVLGIDNVVENEFRWTKSRCIPEAKFAEMKRFVVFPGDVLVTIMGTVGRCSIAPEELPVCISTKHLCTVTLDRTKAHPRFIWGAFLHDASVKQQTRSVGKGAVMEGWNSTIIKRLRLRVPPLTLQKQFAARVSEIRAVQAEQAASRRRLDDLFQSLLHRAFRGEL